MWITTMATVLSVASVGPESDAEKRFLADRNQEALPAAQIWFDKGVDPVLERGDRVRVYYRSTVTTFVAIFQVDTDGTVRMVYPRSPTENHFARANREYRLLFPRSPYWNVGDRPGLGYFFVVTSPVPFDFSDFRYSSHAGGWDLSVVGNRLYEDPEVAMGNYIARPLPNWAVAQYGLDFVSYSVGAQHQYPRFLCYDCHGFKPCKIWDPYRYTCKNFRVVVYDDLYFYQSRRYRGDQVVSVGRTFPTGPRFGFKERGRGERGTPLVVSVPDAAREPGSGALRGRAIPRGDVRLRPPMTRQGGGARPTTPPEAKRPVLQRRPRGNGAVTRSPSQLRGATVKRSAPPRLRRAAKKGPARRPRGTPTSTGRPGG